MTLEAEGEGSLEVRPGAPEYDLPTPRRVHRLIPK